MKNVGNWRYHSKHSSNIRLQSSNHSNKTIGRHEYSEYDCQVRVSCEVTMYKRAITLRTCPVSQQAIYYSSRAAAQTLLPGSLLLFPPILFHLFKHNHWLLANLQNSVLVIQIRCFSIWSKLLYSLVVTLVNKATWRLFRVSFKIL